MAKYFSTLLIISTMLLLTSCSLVGSRVKMLNLDGEQKRADIRMEQIVSAIKLKDKDALKSLFSEKALDEADDLDDQMDSFFSFVQGDIQSWESDGWSSDGEIRYGKRSMMIRSSHKITTAEKEYSFFVIDYNTDTINPLNEGVYMIQVRTDSYNAALGPWQKRMRAGFYIPELERLAQ